MNVLDEEEVMTDLELYFVFLLYVVGLLVLAALATVIVGFASMFIDWDSEGQTHHYTDMIEDIKGES